MDNCNLRCSLFTFILPIIVVVSLYLATAGIVIGILVCFIAVGLSYRHIKKRKVIGEEEREVDEEDMTGDFESMKIVSKQNVPSRGGFSNVVIEVGEKSSATSSNSPDIPMGTDDSPREMAHGMSTHTAGNRLQSKPRKNRKEEDDISSVSSSDSDSSDSDSSSDESEAIKPPKSSRKKSKDVVMAMKARSGNKGSKKHRRDDSTAADSLAVVAEATSTNKRERLSKKQSESRSNEAGNRARSQNGTHGNENLDKETLDENKAREMRACMNDKSLSRDEREHKLDEIKARYSSKKLQEKAKSANFNRSLDHIEEEKHSNGKSRRRITEEPQNKERPPISSSKSKRRTVDGSSRDVGHSPGKSRRNLGDEGKPPSGPSRRRITDEPSGRKGENRHKSTTKRKESQSSDSSDDKAARNSKRRSTGDSKREGKHSSEKSRRRTSDEHAEEKKRERKGKGSSSEKHDSRKSSDKSNRRMESSEDEEPPERAPSRNRGSDRKRDGERRNPEKKRDFSEKKHSSKTDSQRSKSRR
jgi:hypothetical protein